MTHPAPRRIAIVTGTRADFGLLTPVIRAIEAHPRLEPLVIVTGVHLLRDAASLDDIGKVCRIAARFPMQRAGETGRHADARAVARGIAGMTDVLERFEPDVVLVLGDRIEAFAAAGAAAVAGSFIAHIHGGDRAEGVADEAMRHAISKLAHVHLVACQSSHERLLRMGEQAARIFTVGSPALDDLASMPPLDDAAFADLGAPMFIILLHPTGDREDLEQANASSLLYACAAHGPTCVLAPNQDPGAAGILHAYADAGVDVIEHLPRATFIGLLRRARALVGNSSAGLIETTALPTWSINIGPRQTGRERSPGVIDVAWNDPHALDAALMHVRTADPPVASTVFGTGDAGARIADVLARVPETTWSVHKVNAY
ncbi:MAG: UDP-N-acetylglucosamine 2-epimerase (hydrolyzing) [Phycisphaerales bacterium]|nr:UDP-N-acetylglucosamine 2-epimerase (hydrolyzing) [Phycisphaerales bacterium]